LARFNFGFQGAALSRLAMSGALLGEFNQAFRASGDDFLVLG
jgi:hypothetical protein